MSLANDLQLALVTAIARIEQIHGLPEDDPLRCLLIKRLATCDAPRLRRHLVQPHRDGNTVEWRTS